MLGGRRREHAARSNDGIRHYRIHKIDLLPLTRALSIEDLLSEIAPCDQDQPAANLIVSILAYQTQVLLDERSGDDIKT